jgi:hypothetical protein
MFSNFKTKLRTFSEFLAQKLVYLGFVVSPVNLQKKPEQIATEK